MAACGACNTTILFGGVQDGGQKYCNNECHYRGYLRRVADQLPRDTVRAHADAVHRGMCPKCNGPGPVDVHTSYRVWSAFVLTSWKNTPQVSCRGCGVKSQLGDSLFSLVLGWWGFPWGIIMTPVQIVRNITGMLRRGNEMGASDELERMVGINLASQVVARQ